jgi:cytochrome P450
MGAVALPPGPRLPPLVQTLAFLFGARRYFDACRRRYGDVVWMSTAFDRGFVMVFDPDVVKQVFQAPPDRLRAGEANAVLGPLLGSRSVLLLDGAEHLRQRRLLLPPFHGEKLRAHEALMREAADAQIDAWPRDEEFRLLPSMQALTLDVISTAIFGVVEDVRRRELQRRVRAVLEPMQRRLGFLVFALSGGRFGDGGAMARFEGLRRELDAMLFEEIAARREAPDLEERDDVMSMLLLARDEDGAPMTDAEIRDELVTLLVAGHETAATGLAWTFDLLLHHPAALERVRTGDAAFLDAVVKESLRVRPVVPGIGRVVRGGDLELGGYRIPEGAEVNPSIGGIHRRAASFPDPGAFRPERFLGDDVPDTYTWVPFGGGTRRCLGASFALLEMRVVVARVLERCDLRPARREL